MGDSIQLTDESCDTPPFDANAYFYQALGVAAYDEPAQEVILSFTRKQGLHFRAQPFFQFLDDDILVDTEDEFRVKLMIIVNNELIYELARLGNSVRVITPKPLVDKLTTFLREALHQYQ